MPTADAPAAALAAASSRVVGAPRSGRAWQVWGTTWRMLLASLLGAGAFAVMVVDPPRPTPAQIVIDVVLGLATIVLLPWRRRWPFPLALLAAVTAGFSSLGMAAAGIMAISHATHRRWKQIAVVAAVWTASGLVYDRVSVTLEPMHWSLVVGGDLLAYGFCVATGAYIGGRRDLLASLRAQVEAANRERLGLEDRARLTERSRIAREMHDVLAHRISLVAMHAGALAYRTDLTREETAEAATVVRDNAHRALTELRQVLGVLRDPDSGTEPDRPQPTLADLPELLAEFAATGTTLDLDDALGEAVSDLPGPVGRNAYRIVQEALTNARKHAPGRPVRVHLSGSAGDRVHIAVTNPLPDHDPEVEAGGAPTRPPGAGMGLTGLVERARLAGGELTYGHRSGYLFTVRAWLPWPS